MPGSSVEAVYTYDVQAATFTRIASTLDLFPGFNQAFSGFSRLRTDRGDVAFLAYGSSGIPFPSGIVTNAGGSLRTLVSNRTIVPGAGTPFTALANVNMEFADGHVAFTGGWRVGLGSRDGVFSVDVNSGRLALIAAENQMLPSGVLMSGASNVDVADGRVAFAAIGAGSPNWGIYWADASGGTIREVATTLDVNPLTGTPFTTMSFPRIDENDIVFYGWSNGTTNALHRQGDLAAVLDPSMSLPGGGNLGSFESFDLSHERVVFEVRTPGPIRSQVGLFQLSAGQVSRILGPGDVIDGLTVEHFTMSEDALSGDRLALVLRFTTGEQAIYLVDLSTCETYGSGIPGHAGRTPTIFTIGDPRLGQTLRIELRDTSPSALFAGLLVGGARASVPAFGGTLLVVPTLVMTLPIRAPEPGIPFPHASLALPLPGDPALVGTRFYAQGFFADAAAVQGVSTTRGLQCELR